MIPVWIWSRGYAEGICVSEGERERGIKREIGRESGKERER